MQIGILFFGFIFLVDRMAYGYGGGRGGFRGRRNFGNGRKGMRFGGYRGRRSSSWGKGRRQYGRMVNRRTGRKSKWSLAAVARREVEKASRGEVKVAIGVGGFPNVQLFSEFAGATSMLDARNYFRGPVTQLLPPCVKGERQRFFIEGVQIQFVVDVGVRMELIGVCYPLEGMNGEPVKMKGSGFYNAVPFKDDGDDEKGPASRIALFSGHETGVMDGKGPFAIDQMGDEKRMKSADGSLFGCEIKGGGCKPVGMMNWRVEGGARAQGRVYRKELVPGPGSGAARGLEFDTQSEQVYCKLEQEVVKEADEDTFPLPLVLLMGIRSKGSGSIAVHCGNIRGVMVRLRYRGPY